MFVAESHLGTEREVGEGRVVNSFREPSFPAPPMDAGIKSQSEPTIEIIGKAGASAARIRFQAAAQREQCSWKLAVHIRAGMKEGISAVKLPLGSRLVLSCGEGGKRAQYSNHCRQHCQNPARVAL